MSPEDLRALLQARPFQPFRLYLTDGSFFDVRHPDLAMPTRRTVVIGIGGSDLIPDRAITLALIHIVRIELLETPAGAAQP